MPAGFVELRRAEREGGVGLTWKRGESEVLALSAAVEVELAEANNLTVDGQRHSRRILKPANSAARSLARPRSIYLG